MQAAAHAQSQLHNTDLAVTFVNTDLVDAGVRDSDAGSQLRDDAALMFQFDPQFHGEFATDVLVPGQMEDLLAVAPMFRQVVAGLLVDDHALAGGDEADDGVAGDRVTASGKTDHHSLGATDCQWRFLRAWLGAICPDDLRLGRCFSTQQIAGDDIGHAVAQANVCQQLLEVLHAVILENRLDAPLGNLLEGGIEADQYLVEQPLAEGDGFGLALVLEGMADVAARLAGSDEIEPGGIGPCARSGDDLYRLATFQWLGQWRQAPVDGTGNAAVADAGVHRVGEVHRGRALRQFHDPAPGREDVDLVGEQVDVDVLDELQRAACMLLQFQHTFEPLPGAGMVAVDDVVLGL